MFRVLLVLAIVSLVVPTETLAQADCPYQQTTFTPFQETGYPGVQARCRCMRGGTVEGLWQFQLRNTGGQPAKIIYTLTFGPHQQDSSPITIHAQGGVTPVIQTTHSVSSCVFVEMMISVSDAPSASPAKSETTPKGSKKVPKE